MVSRTLQRKTHRNQFDFWINWINAVVAVLALLFFVDRGKLFVITIVQYKSGVEAIQFRGIRPRMYIEYLI